MNQERVSSRPPLQYRDARRGLTIGCDVAPVKAGCGRLCFCMLIAPPPRCLERVIRFPVSASLYTFALFKDPVTALALIPLRALQRYLQGKDGRIVRLRSDRCALGGKMDYVREIGDFCFGRKTVWCGRN